jgi:ParB-like chromosome segregation protein Spo0J
MKIETVPIRKVKLWDKNPRNIKTKDFERLKKQIKELGIYKPLIACSDGNGKYMVLGGNMRLRALQEMGIKDVDISIVKADTEAQRIKYALSDNDRAGEYMEQELAELVYSHIEEINLEDFKVDLGYSISIKNVMEEFGPDLIPKEKEVDENIDTDYKCPKCGYEWSGKPR